MLLSMVFVLRPLTESTLPLTQGNAIHAWFLHLVRQQEPQLASWLHSQEQRKPFTTSPLQGRLRRQGASALLRADHTYWLRITSLVPDLSACLLTVEAAPPPRVRLFDVEFAVCAVTSQAPEHPWAQRSTYEQLYTRAVERPQAFQHTLDFVSPTVFRSQGRNQLMPVPRLIFASLWESWHAFAPVPLPPALLPVLSTEVDLLRYELKTQMYDFGSYRQVGFVGPCTFGLPRRQPADVLWGMQLLLESAFFTGVGYKTTMGMGQTRWLARPWTTARTTAVDAGIPVSYGLSKYTPRHR
jgi:CRISPR-associated endoribonuclease Cas6